MNYKYLKNFSFFFSIIFLVIITFLISFIFFVSEKPLKINVLNFFDRQSVILKKQNVTEIGDIYISFNKLSKKFEFLIENIVIDELFFPSVLINVDLSISDNFFNTSLKLFDGEISYRKKDKEEELNFADFSEIIKKIENNSFLNFFSEVEIINNKLIFLNKNYKSEYLLDLNYKKKKLQGLLSEYENPKNNLNFSMINEQNFVTKVSANDFNVDFLQPFFPNDSIFFNKLNVSGDAELNISNSNEVNNFYFGLNLTGNLEYFTNFGKKNILFNKDSLKGFSENNNIKITSNFMVDDSELIVGLKKVKNKKPIFYLEIDKISIKNLLKVWPKNLSMSTFNWMNKNSLGNISNVKIEVESDFSEGNYLNSEIKGKFDCINIEISYMESMPSVKNIFGSAKIINDKIIFNINSGNSKNLFLSSGEIILYDLQTDFEKADISLDIKGNNDQIVNYLELTRIEKKNYSKLQKINGDVTLNLKLKFPLLVDLEAEQIEYLSKASIMEGKLNNIYKNYSIDNLNLDIEVNPNFIKFFGNGKINDSYLEFEGEQKTVNDQIIDKINGKFFYDSKNILTIFPNFLEQASGIVDINFNINNQNDKIKIEGIGDTNQLIVNSKFLGDNLNFKDGKIRFLISPYNKNYSGFFDLKTKNIDLEVNTVFSDNALLQIKIDKFLSPLQDFKMNFDLTNSIINFEGNRIFTSKIDLNEKSFISDFANLKFILNIENLLIGKNRFTNPIVNFHKVNNEFEDLNVELIGEKDYHKIKIIKEQLKKSFILESNYAPRLLSILDIDIELNTGSLKIEGEKPENSNIYKGNIAGKDLVFLDAPLFADFISLFSLKGLAQKLKDGGIIFEDFTGRYEFSDKKLRLIDSLIKGSELGVSFDTVMNTDNNYFLTTGTIIPAYTLNTLITNFPIVGDIITAGSPEEGLLGANFKIEKLKDDYDISYNPISVFVPNIIKNFLTD